MMIASPSSEALARPCGIERVGTLATALRLEARRAAAASLPARS
jgi:hypothetical protein